MAVVISSKIVNRTILYVCDVKSEICLMCIFCRDNNPNLYSENMEHHGYDLSESSLIEACATSDYQNAYERKSEEYGLYCKCLCEHIRKDRPVVENFQKAHAG